MGRSSASSRSHWEIQRAEEKARREARWRARKQSNPFVRNVGASKQMFALELNPAGEKCDYPGGPSSAHVTPEANPADLLAQAATRAEMEADAKRPGAQRRHNDNLGSVRLSRLIMKRKYLDAPPDPELMTWIERCLVRHLYESNPAQWTPERLSEGFPATPKTIKRYLRGFDPRDANPDAIRQIDAITETNWAKAVKGQLDMSEDLKRRLDDYKQRPQSRKLLLSSLDLAKQEIMERNRRANELPALKPGRIGDIIKVYKDKVKVKDLVKSSGQEAGSKDAAQSSSRPIVVDSSDLFAVDSEFDPELDRPHPYRDTAIMNTKDDFKSDRPVTFEEFNQQVSFSQVTNREELRRINPIRAEYQKWLESERDKEKTERLLRPKKLTAEDIAEMQAEQKAEDVLAVPKFLSKDDSTVPFGGPDKIEEKIRVPADQLKSGGVYEINNAHYDEEGNFLYRIPVETMT